MLAPDILIDLVIFHYEDNFNGRTFIPDVDLQTDTYAFKFMLLMAWKLKLCCILIAYHNTSGNVTVTVTGRGNQMISLSLANTNGRHKQPQDLMIHLLAFNDDSLTFAITEASQRSRVNMKFANFRRSI